jgi:hypothetical protein
MKLLRSTHTSRSLYAGLALLIVAAACVVFWLVTQLDQMSDLVAQASQSRADYAALQLFVVAAVGALIVTAAMLGLWLWAGLGKAESNPDIPGMQSGKLAALPLVAASSNDRFVERRGVPPAEKSAMAAATTPRPTVDQPPALAAIRLISSNPNPIRSRGRERRGSAHIVAVPALPAPAAPPTRRWAAARQEFSWE